MRPLGIDLCVVSLVQPLTTSVFLCCVLFSNAVPPAGCMSSVVSPLIQIHVPLQGLVDVGGEIVKMEKVSYALEQKLAKLNEQMSSASYAKVPEDTKKKNTLQHANDTLELQKLQASINNFKSVLTPEQTKQYLADKLASFQSEADKLSKSIAKMREGLPAEVSKQPKKSLQKIAEAEQEMKDIEQQMKDLQTKM